MHLGHELLGVGEEVGKLLEQLEVGPKHLPPHMPKSFQVPKSLPVPKSLRVPKSHPLHPNKSLRVHPPKVNTGTPRPTIEYENWFNLNISAMEFTTRNDLYN